MAQAVAKGSIQLDDVSKIYGGGDTAVHALQTTTLDISAGDFVTIVGPSGCGKTTLLKIVGDIIRPSTGTVTIDNAPASSMRQARRLGYVFQTPVLLPWRTVYRNVMLPFDVAGETKRGNGSAEEHARQLRSRIEDILDTVGLLQFAERLPHELSGGMQSRVALARALVYEPTVLLMDEPFSSLDELTRTDMALHLLKVWKRVRTTVVFITHHIEEAIFLSNRVLVMSEGPGAIIREIKVDLPRPRTLETRRLDEFRDMVEDLVAHFHAHRTD